MKKILLAVVLFPSLLLMSCVGGSSDNKAISEAEKQVPVVSSPLLGELPSWQKQYKAARDIVKQEFSEKVKSISSDDAGKAMKEMDKYDKEGKAAEEALKQTLDKVRQVAFPSGYCTLQKGSKPGEYTEMQATLVVDKDLNILLDTEKIDNLKTVGNFYDGRAAAFSKEASDWASEPDCVVDITGKTIFRIEK